MATTDWEREFRLVPVPTVVGVDGVSERVNLAGMEKILEAQYAEGFTLQAPIDLFQPAVLFVRSCKRASAEIVDMVLDRIDLHGDGLDFAGVAPSEVVIRRIVEATIPQVY